jgi:HlyD family secretion protein
MTATVEIEVKSADAVLGVPVQAVVHRRRKDLPDSEAIRAWAAQHAASTPNEKARDAEARYIKIVFVDDHGIARARPVETGISDEQRVGILNGLSESDLVITGPFRALDELKDGDAVVPLEQEGKAPGS